MTKQELCDRYLDKSIDYDGAFGAQCVDLFRQYVSDLGLPQFAPVEGAADLWKQKPEGFHKIPNETDTIPRVGDIVVFGAGTPYSRYGHVAIVIDACLDDMQVLEQDGFRQEKKCYQSWRSYVRCLGFFRPGVDAFV